MKTIFGKNYKKIVFSKENLAKFLKLIDGFNIIEINPNELSFLTNGKKKDFETIGFVCPIRTRFFRYIRDESESFIQALKKIKQVDFIKNKINNTSLDEMCFEILGSFIPKRVKPYSSLEYKSKVKSACEHVDELSKRIQKTFIVNSDLVNMIRSFNEENNVIFVHCHDIKNCLKTITPCLNLHKGLSIVVSENFSEHFNLLKSLNYKPLFSKCKEKQIWFKKP